MYDLQEMITTIAKAKKSPALHNQYEEFFLHCSVANPKTWKETAHEMKKNLQQHTFFMNDLFTDREPLENKNLVIQNAMRYMPA